MLAMKKHLQFDDSNILTSEEARGSLSDRVTGHPTSGGHSAPHKRNAGMVDMVLMMPDLFRHGRK